jgi:fatty acyl-CoA reductase
MIIMQAVRGEPRPPDKGLVDEVVQRKVRLDGWLLVVSSCLTTASHVAQATSNMAALAQGCARLRAFVHVSTAYVNANQPRGRHVEEQIYLLRTRDGSAIRHARLAAELAALPRGRAERRVHALPMIFRILIPYRRCFLCRMLPNSHFHPFRKCREGSSL